MTSNTQFDPDPFIQSKEIDVSIIEKKEQQDDDYQLQRLRDDPSYYWQIWLQYRKKILSYCLFQLTHNLHDAQDLCSETMLKGYQKLAEAEGEIKLFPWFLRACKTTHIDMLRRQRVSQNYQQYVKSEEACDYGEPLDRQEMDHAMLRYVQQQVEQLPTQKKIIANDYFFAQKSYQELSEQYGYSESYIRKQVFNIRAYLKPACHRFANAL